LKKTSHAAHFVALRWSATPFALVLLSMIRIVFFVALLAYAQSAFSQKNNPSRQYRWWVQFADKNQSPYCTCRPAEFLSPRSLERRAKSNVAVTEEDFPPNPQYIRQLRQRPGVLVHGASRWLNGAVIIADSAAMLSITPFQFVQSITLLGADLPPRNPPTRPLKRRVPADNTREAEERFGPLGYSYVNLNPLGTPALYALGARGRGIWVAVMDGGFTYTDTIPTFDSVAVAGRLWFGPDLVERDQSVLESSTHGTSVLSVMAANAPGYFVGAAPDATYFLLKTEETGSESPAEEANWVLGAEWADSIGVDVINASLGYTEFDDKSLNHNYLQLDGRTALGSRGATIAARKGMIICNAAGNSGDETWRYLGVPADAPGIIAVGATDSQTGKRAEFSSWGPSADGRIKPDLVAPGSNVIVTAQPSLDAQMSAGTSIASPILAGSLAALWSAFPTKSDQQILDAVFASADQATRPDARRGFGQPNLFGAWLRLAGYPDGQVREHGFFDRTTGTLRLLVIDAALPRRAAFSLHDVTAREVLRGELTTEGYEAKTFKINNLEKMPRGTYVLRVADQHFLIGM
jgi:serine protease AprX